ncbi:MAG: hypothetical protein MHM6MM_008529, partial [Cercozoa sp. M6MM]
AIAIGVAEIVQASEVTELVNDHRVYDDCHRSNSSMNLLPKIPIVIAVLWAIKLCVTLRDAPPEFREASQIEIIVWLSLVTTVVLEIVKGVYAGRINTVARTSAVGTFLIVAFVVLLYTVPRVMSVHCGAQYAILSNLLSSGRGSSRATSATARRTPSQFNQSRAGTYKVSVQQRTGTPSN